MDRPYDVSRALHLGELTVARLAELPPVVFSAAEADPVAAAIVERLDTEVIAFAAAAIRRLDLTDADPDVVLGGGLLTALAPRFLEAIARGIAEVAPNARVGVTPSEPIVGAALLGLDALEAAPRTKVRARAELDAALQTLAARRPGEERYVTSG
jgi:N-acetylglucosamine kinase-like BadF-type ATPase